MSADQFNEEEILNEIEDSMENEQVDDNAEDDGDDGRRKKKGGRKKKQAAKPARAKAVKGGVAKEKKVPRPYSSVDTETLVGRKQKLEEQYNTSSARLVLTKSKINKYEAELKIREQEGQTVA